MQETRADVMKGDWHRYAYPTHMCRNELAIHPEVLCDIDILDWREGDRGFDIGRAGELADRWDSDDAILTLRNNDVPQTQHQLHSHQVIRSLF